MQRSSALFAARLAATSSLLRAPTTEEVCFQKTVAAYDDAGADAAATSTKEFVKLQSALIPYRIVRLNSELKAARELGFGALPGGMNLCVKALVLCFLYGLGLVAGRRSFFLCTPPLTEEQLALKAKANEAKQEQIAKAYAVGEAKRLARLEKDKEREEKNKAAVEAAYAAAEERRAQKALARERGY